MNLIPVFYLVKVKNMNFHGTIWKTGNSHVLTIPADFIEHGQLKVGKTYKVTLRVVEDGESSN